jgi:hypothetical protein
MLGIPPGFAIPAFSVALSFWAGMDGRNLLSQLTLFKKPESYLLPVVILLLLFFTETNEPPRRKHRGISGRYHSIRRKRRGIRTGVIKKILSLFSLTKGKIILILRLKYTLG